MHDLPQIIQEMHSAYRLMVQYRKNHQELRATYLEQLAEAIVINRSPNSATTSAIHILEEHKLQVLKQLMTHETMRRTYRKIKTTLSPIDKDQHT